MNNIKVRPVIKAENEPPNGLNHDHCGVRCPGGADPLATFNQGHHRQEKEHRQLDAEQHFLEIGGYLDPDVTDQGHHYNPGDADHQNPHIGGIVADCFVVEQQEHVLAGDLRQAGHDQEVGGDDPPAPHPPDAR